MNDNELRKLREYFEGVLRADPSNKEIWKNGIQTSVGTYTVSTMKGFFNSFFVHIMDTESRAQEARCIKAEDIVNEGPGAVCVMITSIEAKKG